MSNNSDTQSNASSVTAEMERDWSKQASDHFERGHFDKCHSLMTQLHYSRSNDPKYLHNLCVLEYAKSAYCNTDEFTHKFQQACTKNHICVESIDQLSGTDQCCAFYNHSVQLYHLRRYNASLAIVEKLFQFIEPMEDSLSRRVMFLLTELYLCIHQPDKALAVIAFMDKYFFGKAASPEKDSFKESQKDTSLIESLKNKVGQIKVRCFLMLRSMKSCKRELKALVTSTNSTPVNYLRANFEYNRGNLRKAVRFLNIANSSSDSSPGPKPTSETGECLPVVYYNNLGVIHFYMRKPNLATFYLRNALQQNQLACQEFNKIDPGRSLSGRPIQTIGVSRHFELLYNMGVQLLYCGSSLAAFDCLIETAQQYQSNPRLWLRLAECCIVTHKASNDEDRKLSRRLEVIQGSIGTGVHKKLLLGPTRRSDTLNSESGAMPVSTLEFASLCLCNALTLLPEIVQANPNLSSLDDNHDSSWQASDMLLIQAPPGNPMRKTEVDNLRCSVLTSSAYVALCLNDHIMAREYANRLLVQPRLSPAQKYLGHMYLAEALVASDRIADAVGHLNPDNITDISTGFPEVKLDRMDRLEQEKEKNSEKDSQIEFTTESKADLYPWSPNDVGQAKAIMQYNLGTAHAIRGEYEKAMDNLKQSEQSIGDPAPAQVKSLNVYLELMEGQRSAIQSIVKEHFGLSKT